MPLISPAKPEDLRREKPQEPIYEPVINEFKDSGLQVARVNLEYEPYRVDNVVLNLRNKLVDLGLNRQIKVAKRGEVIYLYQVGVEIPD